MRAEEDYRVQRASRVSANLRRPAGRPGLQKASPGIYKVKVKRVQKNFMHQTPHATMNGIAQFLHESVGLIVIQGHCPFIRVNTERVTRKHPTTVEAL